MSLIGRLAVGLVLVLALSALGAGTSLAGEHGYREIAKALRAFGAEFHRESLSPNP